MSALVAIFQEHYIVLASDSRVGLAWNFGDTYLNQGHFDGVGKFRDAGDGCILFTSTQLERGYDEADRELLEGPIPGSTVRTKAQVLQKRFKGKRHLTFLLAGFDDGPAFAHLRGGGLTVASENVAGQCITMGLDEFVQPLWRPVYVKTEDGYEQLTPIHLSSRSMSVGKAVDTAIFLIQAGGKYLELATTDGDDRWDRPRVGGPIDLVLMQNLTEVKIDHFRIGGVYGLDHDYMRLTQAVENHAKTNATNGRPRGTYDDG